MINGNKEPYLGVHVKWPYVWPNVTKSEFSRNNFIAVPNVKFDGNSSSGRRADTYGQADGYDELKKHFLR